MLPGTYTGGLTVHGGPTITIVGTGAKLFGSGIQHHGVDVGAGANVSIRGLEIDSGNSATGSLSCASAVVALHQLTVRPEPGTGAGSFFTAGCLTTIDRVDFTESVVQFDGASGTVDRTRFSGFQFSSSSTVQMTNSVVSNELDIVGGSYNATIAFCTIFGGQGVQAGGSSPTGIVFSNDIIGNTVGFADSVSCSSCVFMNNIIFPQSTPVASNTLADPKLEDPAMGDFHLHVGSVAIDAANSTSVNHDFDGLPRPHGIASDIGAFEAH